MDTLKSRDEQIRGQGRVRGPDGNVVGRYPILNNDKDFHDAMGHPSDEVTKMMAQSTQGCPVRNGYSSRCPYCLSRRGRRQPKFKEEGLDRRTWVIGEAWTMDFTAMCLVKSMDSNQVGTLFEELMTSMKVGQTLKDHTSICDALDWLWHYVKTERRGVQLRFLYVDCDPIWFSVDDLKRFLRKVGRWCFRRSVALFTNSPGKSQQNGRIEGSMNEVMGLTSAQLQCSFLKELFWDRSFMLAVFILARRFKNKSNAPVLKNSWHKIPWTAWSGRLVDLTVLICAFGATLIVKNDRKSNRFTRQGELALFMGVPQGSKGWLVWNVPMQKYQIRYNVRVVNGMMIKPAVVSLRNQLQAPGPMVPEDEELMGQNVLAIVQKYDPEKQQEPYNNEVIAFSSYTGQPVKVMPFMDLEEDMLSSYMVQEEVLPDGDEAEVKEAMGEEVKEEMELLEEKEDHEGKSEDPDENENLFEEADASNEDLRLFEEDNGVDLEDPRKGLNNTGVFDKVVLNGAEKRWFEKFWKKDNNVLKFQAANPKRKGTDTYHRYEAYKNSKTVGEMKKNGGTKGDLIFAFCRKQCILPEVPAAHVLRAAILRPLLRTSTTVVAARIIAEEMKMLEG